MKKEIKKLKFRKGDKVEVLKDHPMPNCENKSCASFVSKMKSYEKKKGRIIGRRVGGFSLDVDNGDFTWSPCMLKLLSPKPKRVKKEIGVGDTVKVRKSVKVPRWGWGRVSHESIGTVIRADQNDVRVSFPEQDYWNADLKELRLVKSPKPKKDTVKEKKEELIKAIEDHKSSMQVEVQTTTKVAITEGSYYLALSFKDGECIGFDSNLPYKKSISHWDFLSRAIAQILLRV